MHAQLGKAAQRQIRYAGSKAEQTPPPARPRAGAHLGEGKGPAPQQRGTIKRAPASPAQTETGGQPKPPPCPKEPEPLPSVPLYDTTI